MPTVAIQLVRAAVPAADPWDNPPTWFLWHQLLPHVLAATDARHTLDSTRDDVGWLLNQAGVYVLTRGKPGSSRPLFERALSLLRPVLSEDHPDTLDLASNLAFNLYELGQYEQARQLNQDILTRRRRILGDNHPHTLTSGGNLALDLHALGQHEQARQLQQDTLTRRRVLGDDHPRTLASASNLAADLRALGRDDEANQLEEWIHSHS